MYQDGIKKDNIKMGKPWKEQWKEIKNVMKKQREKSRIEKYKEKKMQSKYYSADKENHEWIKGNNDPKKVAAIISMQEQMVETRGWKRSRGLQVESDSCRVCGEEKETLMHLLSGCKMLAGKEYTARHDKALKILAKGWADQECIKVEEKNKKGWERGEVFETDRRKIYWDFEFNLRKTEKARRPDLVLEDKERKELYVVDMACPSERNITEKIVEKLRKYQQLAFELRERKPKYTIKIVPVVIGCLGGGMKDARKQIDKLIKNKNNAIGIANEMVRTVLYESESIIRKVMSGLIQGMD